MDHRFCFTVVCLVHAFGVHQYQEQRKAVEGRAGEGEEKEKKGRGCIIFQHVTGKSVERS